MYADCKVRLEVVEVLCQLVAVVIVGEEALEESQQLREQTRFTHDPVCLMKCPATTGFNVAMKKKFQT